MGLSFTDDSFLNGGRRGGSEAKRNGGALMRFDTQWLGDRLASIYYDCQCAYSVTSLIEGSK